ncbi:hypothetical protein FBY31_3562 [Arthrobacter sp. SLBN-100]|nr:hypothetical protein FBY31_3562 [Arthrobacter sp. SLBN-100]
MLVLLVLASMVLISYGIAGADFSIWLPVIAGVLWLVHAALGAAGHPAYHYSGRILFGGLAALTVLSFGTLFTYARFVPAALKDDSFAGVFEGMLAIEALLVLVGLVFVEVVRVAVTRTIKDSQAAAATQHADSSSSP